MIIYLGIILHEYGANYYYAKTSDGLDKQLATYCREWWDDLPEGSPPLPDWPDNEIIESYFELKTDEDLYTDHFDTGNLTE